MNYKDMNKQQWIKELNEQNYTYAQHKIVIDGKNKMVTYFYMFANEKLKHDKDLLILSYKKSGCSDEIPKDFLNLDFFKRLFKARENSNIFKIPYHWKDTPEDKKFLKHILEVINVRQTDFRASEIAWTYEPGFWLDLKYTQEIKSGDYDYLNIAIIKQLNQSNEEEKIKYLLEIVNETPYYLKYIKSKYKSLLLNKTILSYASDYGLTSLTKEQKNRYEVVKEAFHNDKIHYDNLDIKWKTTEILKDLLNNKDIWKEKTRSYYSKIDNTMKIEYLAPEVLEDKELIKVCLLEGSNLIELRHMNSSWFKDKELKKIALKTYASARIIEDCMDDKEMIVQFFQELKKPKVFMSGINLFEETKRIEEESFKDKEIMENYLSLKQLVDKNYFTQNAIKALKNYSNIELIEFIKINKVVYQVLSEEKRNRWELILPFYEINKNSVREMNEEISEIIHTSGTNFEERLIQVQKYALNEKLNESLEEKEQVKRLKI